MKKINCGGERLFPKSKWVKCETMQGDDEKILGHPLLCEAFERVCSEHQMRHDVALMALCTSTRPYSKTRTWKSFKELCDGIADPIVTSNGGIVPLDFEAEYPFMTYDAPGSKEHDNLYVESLAVRLVKFLTLFPYRKVVFVYMPNKRNRRSVVIVNNEMSTNNPVLPTKAMWMTMTERVPSKKDFRKPILRYAAEGYLWAPLTFPKLMDEIRKELTT